MKKFVLMSVAMMSVTLLAMLLGAGTAGAGPQSDPVTEATATWARVLNGFVNDRGEVDFRGVASHPADLRAYIDFVARSSPEAAPVLFPSRQASLAFYINSYNALAMFNVVNAGIPEALTGFTKIRFFGLTWFDIGGKSRSLYGYENSVIRPFGDERVHFALNCMSVGCPRLPPAPFSAEHLDQELDREATRFFAEARNLRIDHIHHVAHVSEILKFYAEDFLRRSPTLVAYINRYAPEQIPADFRVEFIPYDWTVKAQ